MAFSLLAGRFPDLIALPAWITSKMNGVSLLLALRNLTHSGYAHIGLLLILLLTTAWAPLPLRRRAPWTITSRRRSVTRWARMWCWWAAALLSDFVGEEAYEDEDGNVVTPTSSIPIYLVQPVEQHLEAEGVRYVARVGRFKGSARLGSAPAIGTVLGIDRYDYPRVAYYRRDFTVQSLGTLMNRLALQRDGVIVSRDVITKSGLSVGDPLAIQGLIDASNQAVNFVIVGVLDYWPTVYPVDGSLFVANLDYIHESTGGEKPWEVWLECATTSGTMR